MCQSLCCTSTFSLLVTFREWRIKQCWISLGLSGWSISQVLLLAKGIETHKTLTRSRMCLAAGWNLQCRAVCAIKQAAATRSLLLWPEPCSGYDGELGQQIQNIQRSASQLEQYLLHSYCGSWYTGSVSTLGWAWSGEKTLTFTINIWGCGTGMHSELCRSVCAIKDEGLGRTDQPDWINSESYSFLYEAWEFLLYCLPTWQWW